MKIGQPKALFNYRTILLIILAIAFPAITSTAHAGAWSQKKGHFYSKLTYIYSTASEVYGLNFPATFNDNALYFYGEYGLTNKLTFQASIPGLKLSENQANSLKGTTAGYFAGDYNLNLKYQFLSNPVVAAISAGTKLPLFYEIFDQPPLGNGETDYNAALLLGGSFHPLPLYVTGGIGYRLRGGDFINEIYFDIEAGYTLGRRYLLRAQADLIRSAGDAMGESGLFGFPLEQEKTRVGGGLIFLLNDNIDLDITYLSTISGKNIPASSDIFLGLAWKR